MTRLIDKDAAYAALKHEEETHELSFTVEAFGKAARIIDQMPTIEAEPVKHGRWKTKVIHDTYCFQCSACNSIYNGDTNYCPYCGAEMNGGAENG